MNLTNDFTRDIKNNLKLLDGVGLLVMNDMLNYLLIESSGSLSHSLNYTLKSIENEHDSLKFFVSNYRNASFDIMPAWQVVECRSASVPLTFSDGLEYMKVFELFTFLHNGIHEQEEIFKQLKGENLNIVAVNDQDTVAQSLL